MRFQRKQCQVGSKSNRSKRYTEEFTRDAVALVRSSGKTVTEVEVFGPGQAPEPSQATHALHRGARHPAEAERGQLLGLGLLPLGQRVPLRVVLRPDHSFAAGPAGEPALDFPHVPPPGQRLLTRCGGGGLEQPPLRGRLRRIGPDDGEAGVGEQVPGEHGLAASVRADEVDLLPRKGDHLPRHVTEPDPSTDLHGRPGITPRAHPAPPFLPWSLQPCGPTRMRSCSGVSRPAVNRPCHRAWKTQGRTSIGSPTASVPSTSG